MLRGAALLAMASYHFMWDLADFGYLDDAFPSTGWPKLYARSIASTFLIMAGFSLMLAHGRGIRWNSFWKRLAMIAGSAALVSVGSWFVMPQGLIFFGILHQMALASLIGLLFLRVPWQVTVVIAVTIIAIPNLPGNVTDLHSDIFNPPWLWWIGLSTKLHNSFDYVPVLPWFGVFMLGMTLARIQPLMRWLRQNTIATIRPKLWTAPFAFLGRHSLVFYLVHQPLMIACVYAVSLIAPAPQVAPEVKYIESCEMSCRADRGEKFCKPFCGCTLDRLQQLKLLAPFQSGAISVDDDARLKDIAVECTTTSQ
jgi:uncharacterized membrane protein